MKDNGMARPKIARRLPVADRSWRARGEIIL